MVWKNYTASFESSKNNDLLQKRERQLWPMSVCRRCRIYSTYYSWFTETIPYTPRRGLPTMSKLPKVSQEQYISWRMHNLQFDISRIFDPESSKPQSCWSHTFDIPKILWHHQCFYLLTLPYIEGVRGQRNLRHGRIEGMDKSRSREKMWWTEGKTTFSGEGQIEGTDKSRNRTETGRTQGGNGMEMGRKRDGNLTDKKWK